MPARESTRPLTAVAITRLRPGETRADTGENAGLRVTKLARDVRYWYRFNDPTTGRKREVTLSYASLHTLAEIRVIFAGMKAQRRMGFAPELPPELRPAPATTPSETTTLTAACSAYISEKVEKRRSPKSAAECARVLRTITTTLGDLPIEELTLDAALAAAHDQIDRGHNAQAGVMLRELAAAIEHAIARRRLPLDFDNVAAKAHTMLKREGTRLSAQRRKRYLTDAELQRLLAWLPTSGFSPSQRIALDLVLQTGCRSGEAIGAAWSDIDVERGVWSIPKNKTDCPREIHLAPRTTEWLRSLELVRRGDFLCQSTKGTGPLQQKSLSETAWRLRRDGKMIDLPAWTAHDLRRSVRTGLARQRCPQPVAESLLGHAADTIVATYNLHTHSEEIREWLTRWNAHLDTLRPSRPQLRAVS